MAQVTKFAALCWCLPILVGAEADFPSALKTGEAAEETPEGAEPSSRQTRQSAAPESYSFQSIRIGADAAEELQLDAPATEAQQQARAARQFSLNVQFPSGFNSNTNPPQFAQQNPSQFGQQSQSQFGQQAPFQNFPSFVQPTQSTPQQTRPQAAAPAFASLPTVRASRPPPNADPRPRQRTQNAQRFQNLPSIEETPRRIDNLQPVERQNRRRLRPAQRQQGLDLDSEEKDFPVFNRAFTSRRQQENQAVVVTENPLVLRCLADAEKHAAEIEELENRTALHIDYAQEKQIEIEVLEAALEEAKNKTLVNNEKLDTLQASLANLTGIITLRDDKIKSLEDDLEQRESESKADLENKDDTILALTLKLDNASAEISNLKEELEENLNEFEAKENQLEEARAKVQRLNRQKKNLLQIVQALAEIGNPALNFSKFLGEDDEVFEEKEEVEHFESGETVEAEEEEASGDYEYETSDATTTVEGSGDLDVETTTSFTVEEPVTTV